MFLERRKGYLDMDAEAMRDAAAGIPALHSNKERQYYQSSKCWWESFCLRCHQPDETEAWQPSWWNRVCPFPVFPTYRQFAQSTCIFITILLIWGITYCVLGETAAPGGQLFGMAMLVICSYFGGYIWLKVTTLPALIGMLLVGIAFQNLGLVHITGGYTKLNSELRRVALVVILTRAGLGLDLDVMKKNYVAILKLGLLPWLVECVAIAFMTHYVLDLPLAWGFLLGSMIASVSPAVVVPCLFRLREQGYGVAKGIPTLVLAAAGIDDSISVAAFGIILSAMFSSGSATYNIVKGPLSIIAGIGFGVVWGVLAGVMPEKGDKYATPLRFNHMLFGGMFAVFGSSFIDWSGAGPLAVVAGGFVAAICWSQQGWPVNNNPVATLFRLLWIVFEPILFAFTGAQVKFSELDGEVMKLGTASLVACLALRILSTYLVGFGSNLNTREKIFIGVTWMAKATVQAALGPAAIDLVSSGRSAGDTAEREERYARVLLAVSVLSIVLTAPLGALLIALLGPRLLSKEPGGGGEPNHAPPTPPPQAIEYIDVEDRATFPMSAK